MQHHGTAEGQVLFHLQSKGFVIVQLRLLGWTPGPSDSESFKPGGRLIFVESFTRSKWYFLCLYHHRAVFLKIPDGFAKEIRHDLVEGYYKALVLLEGNNLRRALEMALDGVRADQKYKLLLKPPGGGAATTGSGSESSAHSAGFVSEISTSGDDIPPREVRRSIGLPVLAPPSADAHKDRITFEVPIDLYPGLDRSLLRPETLSASGENLIVNVFLDSGTSGRQRLVAGSCVFTPRGGHSRVLLD